MTNDKTVTNIGVERFCLVSQKKFEDATKALEGGIGLYLNDFKKIQDANSFDEMQDWVHKATGGKDFMLFMKLDHGAILRMESGSGTPKIIRYIIGNPFIMKEMAKHIPDAGSYAPVTVLVDERADGVHFSYDRMVSFLSPYGNQKAIAVARDLDLKVENLLVKAAS
jgi:uncharacterized protein (DUF302 family)